MASPTVAANAYAALSRIMESGGAEKGGQAATGGPSFSALLKDNAGYRHMEELGTEPQVYYLPPKARMFPGHSSEMRL